MPRLARLERPLLLAALALITAHLLDLAVSGPDTSAIGVALIVAAPLAAAALQPRVTRATRFALGLVVGLLAVGFGGVAHVLHAVQGEVAWTDATGIGFALGGVLLVGAAFAALAAPGRAPRPVHVVRWIVGAAAVFVVGLMPFAMAAVSTHGARLPVDEAALGIAHDEVRIPAPSGHLAAWWVPSRNGAAVLLVHGSGGNRSRVAEEARLLARHGYGVLSIDLPGNGESDGRASGLGDNSQPAVDAALDYLAERPGVDPRRIAGFGSSLGAEVLLEAAARDHRLRAVVADGAARPTDDQKPPVWLMLKAVRAVSGTRSAPPLVDSMPRIAPRPVLFIAGGRAKGEIPANRRYRRAAGPTAQLFAIPEAGHTSGLKARPAEYERRVARFLDGAIG